jgi:hypothetical protein
LKKGLWTELFRSMKLLGKLCKKCDILYTGRPESGARDGGSDQCGEEISRKGEHVNEKNGLDQ